MSQNLGTLPYCIWYDHFLQDKACEDVEEMKSGSSEEEYETDEEWEVERKKQAAILEKDKVQN